MTNTLHDPFSTGRITVFGSLNVDLSVRVKRFPEPGETLSGSELVSAPGGKSSNQAVVAAMLGSTVRIIGAVGNDMNGDFLLDQADAAGVDVSSVARDTEHATGSAMIVVDATGENTIIVSPGANCAHSPASVQGEKLTGSAILCLCLEVPLAAVHAVAEQGRRAGAQILLNLSPYMEVPEELLRLTDVLLVNRAEAELVLGADLGEDWSATLDSFIRRGVGRVVVTLGSDGSVVLDGAAHGEARVTAVAAHRVDVVDTTGCGDAFTGALAHEMASGASLVEAASLASQVSALAATREGTQTSYSAFAHLRESNS